MARARLRGHRRVGGRPREGARHRLHRIRPDRVQPPHRIAPAHDRARAAAALRPLADRDCGRWHRHDRRSQTDAGTIAPIAPRDCPQSRRHQAAVGLVMPLTTAAAGTKFGKTEAGTIWLDPARPSPFRFYQFWLNSDDRDVVAYLKYFTFLDRAAIAPLEAATTSAPEKREAQRVLAREVTALVHGADRVARAEQASRVLFGEDIATLGVEDVLAVFEDVPSTELDAAPF